MTEELSESRRRLRDELLAERTLSTDDFYARAESRLDWPLSRGLNFSHECCDRWATDRSRLALSVHTPEGAVRRWTYYELMRESSALANVFIASGLKRGDRVAALLDQQVEAYIGAIAAWRAGLVYVPLFVGFGVDGLVNRIDSSGASAVLVDHRHRDILAKVQESLTAKPTVFTVSDGSGPPASDVDMWEAMNAASHEHEMVVTQPDEVGTLIYTSGTTGNPKGCLHTYGAMTIQLQSFLRHVMALGPEDVVFGGANPGWSYGLYAVGLGVQSLGGGCRIAVRKPDPTRSRDR
ncbi:AMP-binding protein [Mycobacterium sp.]|uniref:AMP-binding protein n=1 Tax=Mycobacterium sp. TaxID=1785 RepID=UPI003D14544A